MAINHAKIDFLCGGMRLNWLEWHQSQAPSEGGWKPSDLIRMIRPPLQIPSPLQAW